MACDPFGRRVRAMRRPERIVDVTWSSQKSQGYLCNVQIEGLDRAGLLADVSRVLADQHTNILACTMHATKDRVFKVKLSFEASDPTHLEHMLNAIRRVPAGFDAG